MGLDKGQKEVMRLSLMGRRRIAFRECLFSFYLARYSHSCCACRSTLRRRSLKLTRGITSSMGGYLPNTLTEMWEPSRDFAWLKLPTAGSRSIVAISGYVLS